MTKTIKLTIDDQPIEVIEGTTILQACKQLEVEIPVFCYHDRLPIAGNCRMCLVEVEKMPKPVASCSMPVSEGMVVHTQSPLVEKSRHNVLELLLINHPLDCPVCDQGGECDLQDVTLCYGKTQSRYEHQKRQVSNKYMGPLIRTVMTRCIHCMRCVRFLNHIAGTPELAAIHRGEHTEVTSFEKPLTSELSGNLIDICPVGALTSKPYTFQARSWELEKTDSIDVLDALGSHIRVDSKNNKVLRIVPRTHQEINDQWISDRTRFAYDALTNQRLDRPYKRVEGKLTPCSWQEAFSIITEKMLSFSGHEMAALVGDFVDVESTYALKLLFDKLNSPHRDCRQKGELIPFETREHYLFNTTLQGLEKADALLIIGTNPRYEAALLNARIRKAQLSGQLKNIGVIGPHLDLSYDFEHLGESPLALKELIEGNHSFSTILKQSKNPCLILGQSVFNRIDTLALISMIQKLMDTFPSFIQENWNGYNVLHTAAGRVGALDVGFVPTSSGLSTLKILEACQEGMIKLIYLHGVDEISPKSFGNAFVIYQGHHGDQGAHRADVILPGAAYTEKNALYVNTEGRVQKAFKAVCPPHEAKEDWKIIQALSIALHKSLNFETHEDLLESLYKDFPHFNEVDLIHPKKWASLPTAYGLLLDENFKLPYDNFYVVNSITRHSANMASCVREIIQGEKSHGINN